MCIFCQIVQGDLPAYKIYEDDHVLAFLDSYPTTLGHTLVITKKHYANLEEIPAEELAYLISAVKKIGLIMKKRMKIEGYNVCENNGSIAGQAIDHIHFHLIPRRQGDVLEPWPKRSYQPGEAEKILKIMTTEN